MKKTFFYFFIFSFLLSIKFSRVAEGNGGSYKLKSYPWKMGDPLGSLKNAKERCAKENGGVKNCKKRGLVWSAEVCQKNWKKKGRRCKKETSKESHLYRYSYKRKLYPWKLGDLPFTSKNAKKRCAAENDGVKNCEKIKLENIFFKCMVG